MERLRGIGIARVALPIFIVVAIAAMSIPVAADATTLPTQSAGVSQAVSFAGSGFDGSERISLWTTAPSGTVTSLDAISSNTDGSFVTSVAFPSAGFWQVTAQGTTSGRTLIGAYNVGTGGTSGTGGNVPAPPASGQNAVAIGQTVTFTASGFNANELVSLWMTAPEPDSRVIALPGSGADNNGRVAVPVSFPSAGYWQVTAQGLDSRVNAITGYNVGGSTSGGTSGVAPPPAAGVATVGQAVTFTASGYQSGETVAAWTTAPDSQVAPLSSSTADNNGNVTFSTAFPTPGYWQVTTQGVTSGVPKIVGYTVTG